jgi:hypothetical protein
LPSAIQPSVIVACAQLVAGVQIGNVGELGMLQSALEAMIARRFDGPEQAAEGEQPVVVERLIMKHQHAIAVDSARQLRNGVGRQVGGKIDRAHLAHEDGMKLTHLDGHGCLRRTAPIVGTLNGAAAGPSIERPGVGS